MDRLSRRDLLRGVIAMGGMAMFGGGWAFQNFTTSIVLKNTLPAPGGGVNGPWVELVASLGDPIRWMELFLFNTAHNNRDYIVALGTGPAGAETQWQPRPIDEGGFYARFDAAAVYSHQWRYTIPTKLERQTRLSAQLYVLAAGATTIDIVLAMFN